MIRGAASMDPESGLDAVREVGITNGKITAIVEGGAARRAVIDAGGLVVAPGFIDPARPRQDAENLALRARDGVTARSSSRWDRRRDAFYAAREDRTLIHYGVSIGHIPVRMAVMGDPAGLSALVLRRAGGHGDADRPSSQT